MKYKKLSVLLVAILLLSFVVAAPVIAATGSTKGATNPVLIGTSAWEVGGVGAASVIFDGAIYKMWYSGIDADGFTSIGYATSPDGITWTKYVNNPVLTKGAMGQWDAQGVFGPSVIKDGSTYKMWYTGVNAGFVVRIGYATSADGITWIKNASYVLDVGGALSWDGTAVGGPSVIKDGSTYKMWFTGRSDDGTMLGLVAIGYATSVDGINWTKGATNPIFQRSPNPADWDARGVGACSVFKVVVSGTGHYTMYYTGYAPLVGGILSRIGQATSSDGLTWVRSSANPILDVGGGGSWEEKGVGAPAVIGTIGSAKMWYTGANNSLLAKIGYATIYTTPPAVPASSNLGTGLMLGAFAALIALVVLRGARRVAKPRI